MLCISVEYSGFFFNIMKLDLFNSSGDLIYETDLNDSLIN